MSTLHKEDDEHRDTLGLQDPDDLATKNAPDLGDSVQDMKKDAYPEGVNPFLENLQIFSSTWNGKKKGAFGRELVEIQEMKKSIYRMKRLHKEENEQH